MPAQLIMPTAYRETTIANKVGLHARPAMQFVDLASRFQSSVKVKAMGDPPREADGKSVMQMIVLEALEGTVMRIEADGPDAEEAVKQLAALIDSKFGEE